MRSNNIELREHGINANLLLYKRLIENDKNIEWVKLMNMKERKQLEIYIKNLKTEFLNKT